MLSVLCGILALLWLTICVSAQTSSALVQVHQCQLNGRLVDFYGDDRASEPACLPKRSACPRGAVEKYQSCVAMASVGNKIREIALTLEVETPYETYYTDHGIGVAGNLWVAVAKMFRVPLQESSNAVLLVDSAYSNQFTLEHFTMVRPGSQPLVSNGGSVPSPDVGKDQLYFAVRIHTNRLVDNDPVLEEMRRGEANTLNQILGYPSEVHVFEFAESIVSMLLSTSALQPEYQFFSFPWNQEPDLTYSSQQSLPTPSSKASFAPTTTPALAQNGNSHDGVFPTPHPAPSPTPTFALVTLSTTLAPTYRTTPEYCRCQIQFLGDGICNPLCNTDPCGFDYGDCLSSTTSSPHSSNSGSSTGASTSGIGQVPGSIITMHTEQASDSNLGVDTVRVVAQSIGVNGTVSWYADEHFDQSPVVRVSTSLLAIIITLVGCSAGLVCLTGLLIWWRRSSIVPSREIGNLKSPTQAWVVGTPVYSCSNLRFDTTISIDPGRESNTSVDHPPKRARSKRTNSHPMKESKVHPEPEPEPSQREGDCSKGNADVRATQGAWRSNSTKDSKKRMSPHGSNTTLESVAEAFVQDVRRSKPFSEEGKEERRHSRRVGRSEHGEGSSLRASGGAQPETLFDPPMPRQRHGSKPRVARPDVSVEPEPNQKGTGKGIKAANIIAAAAAVRSASTHPKVSVQETTTTAGTSASTNATAAAASARAMAESASVAAAMAASSATAAASAAMTGASSAAASVATAAHAAAGTASGIASGAAGFAATVTGAVRAAAKQRKERDADKFKRSASEPPRPRPSVSSENPSPPPSPPPRAPSSKPPVPEPTPRPVRARSKEARKGQPQPDPPSPPRRASRTQTVPPASRGASVPPEAETTKRGFYNKVPEPFHRLRPQVKSPEDRAEGLWKDVQSTLERTKEDALEIRKKTFKDLQRQLHPDKNPGCEESATLAFHKLMERRAAYLCP